MPHQDMLINYVPGEECRIALVENGKLEELYTERASDDIHVGNIYRGRVTNVEPSIQAAFIDFGLERNGFLHVSDLHPRYFPGNDNQTERVGHRTPRKERPPIQQCLKRGQRILVQVLKEGIGTKGPTLSSYLSIPGRFLVMMPDMERHGVSRKIEDEEKRREMRKILDDLDPPNEFGFIVRTAGIGRTKTELKRDLAYLMRLWKTIESRQHTGKGPAELYRESDLVIRTLRDVLTNDVQRIIVDDINAAQRAKDFIRIAMPRASVKVIHYDKPIPLLDSFDIERQIETIHSRNVPLPSGGSLVIDTTEALVAIDVNSGKSRDNKDAEATAYETNKEAIPEIARQLRLRDLGGVVVLDLIDMYQHKHRRAIEQRFRDELKKDRARSKITRINDIGLLSLTRQRMRPSLKKSIHQTCSHCQGTGIIKTAESVALDVMRRLAVVLSSDDVARAELRVSPSVGAMLLNRKRHALHRLEQALDKPIEFKFDAEMDSDAILLNAMDSRGVQLDLEKLPPPKPPKFDDSDLVTFEAIDGAEDDFDDEDEADEPEASRQDTDKSAGSKADGKRSDDADDPRKKPETGGSRSADDRHGRRDDSAGSEETASGDGEGDENGGGKRKRRRRRRGGRGRRKRSGDESAQSGETAEAASASGEGGEEKSDRPDDADRARSDDATRAESGSREEQGRDDSGGEGDEENKPRKRRRRRGGRGRRRKSGHDENGESRGEEGAAAPSGDGEPEAKGDAGSTDQAAEQPGGQASQQSSAEAEAKTEADATKSKQGSDASDDASGEASAKASPEGEGAGDPEPTGEATSEAGESKPKPRRRRTKKKTTKKADGEPGGSESTAETAGSDGSDDSGETAEAETPSDAGKETKTTKKKRVRKTSKTGKTTKKKSSRSTKAKSSDAAEPEATAGGSSSDPTPATGETDS